MGADSSPEASTAISADCSPQLQGGSAPGGSSGPFGKLEASRSGSMRWDSGGARPPAPMGLSTALNNGRGGDVSWHFKGQGEGADSPKKIKRVSSDGRFVKSKEASTNDSLGALMDVLSQMDTRQKAR